MVQKISERDKMRRKIEIPLSLSVPYFVVSVFLVFFSLFLLVNLGIGAIIDARPGHALKPIITTLHKNFRPSDILTEVRWMYYIPYGVIKANIANILAIGATGIMLLAIRYLRLSSYIKKNMKKIS